MEGWAVGSGLPCKTPMDGGVYRIIVSADTIHEQGDGTRGTDKECGETEGDGTRNVAKQKGQTRSGTEKKERNVTD